MTTDFPNAFILIEHGKEELITKLLIQVFGYILNGVYFSLPSNKTDITVNFI